VHATAGNISARLPDGWLITPTDACLGTLTRPGWHGSTRGAAGRWRPASKTLALHRRIYGAAPGAAASSTPTARTSWR
jgi:ribulose-5-phosphate 4-epimerase/fuculose-1-phosphate aldolase